MLGLDRRRVEQLQNLENYLALWSYDANRKELSFLPNREMHVARIGVNVTPILDLADAERRIQAYVGPPEEFTLAISETLLDPMGVNMAIITDLILARGWAPDGFVQHEGYRLFRYSVFDDDTPRNG